MTILENIKVASLAARKAHETDKAAALVTLLSEATMIGKNDGNRVTTEAETIAVIKKFIKNIDETLLAVTAGATADQQPKVIDYAFVNGDPIAVKLLNEKSVLKSFLPTQLKEHEIKEELNNLYSPGIKLGDLLKIFKVKFDGRYDGGTAAKLAKEIISR
jgi:uncharacterized protein